MATEETSPTANATGDLPTVTRKYQNHHLDSTRWEVYTPRKDDIVVTTSYKSGTTWMQGILMEMLHADVSKEDRKGMLPWLDSRFHDGDKTALKQKLDDMPDRRVLKSHLPLDGLPYYAQVKYIIVCRDARDVFMSFYNHYVSYTDVAYDMLNGEVFGQDRIGDPLPRCPDDIHELWRNWISQGWFDNEVEGYPYWANMGHTATYWRHRHLDNFLFLHYTDMLEDHAGAIRDVASFIGLTLTDQEVERIRKATTFDTMRQSGIDAEKKAGGNLLKTIFRGGAATFFNKGSDGRWVDVLTDEELAMYEETKDKLLPPDCAAYLEQGKKAWIPPNGQPGSGS